MAVSDEFIVVIPARAGSKRIIGKNLRTIGEKPMIQFTLEAATSLFNMNNIIVTSDDEAVLDLAKKMGIKIPFIRPDYLSTDSADTSDVIVHALEWFKLEHKILPENIILLQPTSPFRTSEDILQAINIFLISNTKTLVSACEPIQHPGDFLVKNNNGRYTKLGIQSGGYVSGTQSYSEMLFIDGSIYISNTEEFLKTHDIIGDNPEVFKISQSHAIDVDTQFDLDMARSLYLCKNTKKV